jgi:O-antigen/teichoic acid export membrane protein
MDNTYVVATEKKINQHETESLSTRAIRGGLWVFSLRAINRGLGFIRTIILARLLAPEDFGLLGIAMLSISTLETFSQSGFQAALIQKKENVEPYLDTAWTVSAVRGIALFLILFLSAPVIASFFNSPKATLVIRVVALSTLLTGLRNIGIVFFQKELEFDKQFFYEFSATLVDITVAITLAFILKNVWALVWGGLAANLTRLLMSYVLHGYRPRVRFEKEKFQELFGFGKWVLASSMIIFLITQGDDIFVGKMLGVTALGLYQIAYLISNLPATEITHVISQVTFPAYSKLQYDLPRLREAYLKVLKLTAFMSLPSAGGIFILAPEFTKIFLGDKWMPMVPAMQILCVFGVTRALNATTGPIFHAVGKPFVLAKVSFIQLIFLMLLIYPLAAKAKLVGVSWAVTIANLSCFVLAFRELVIILEESKRNVFNVLFPTILATLIMIGLIYLLTVLATPILPSILIFIFSILLVIATSTICARISGHSVFTSLSTGPLFQTSKNQEE